MQNDQPYEIISAPGQIYLAALGTSFPALSASPGVGWSLVGTTGNLNLTDAGITIGHPHTVNKFRPLGSTAPSKSFRSEEDLIIRAVLADLSLEQYSHVLNNNTVTTPSGVRKVGIYRGIQVAQRALLVRFDVSPYKADGKSQYEVPRAVQMGQPEAVFNRGQSPVALALEWCALIDLSASSESERLGRFIADEADT